MRKWLPLALLLASPLHAQRWTAKHYAVITSVGVPLDLGTRLLAKPLRSSIPIRVLDVGAFELLQEAVQGERARLLHECAQSGACHWSWREVYLPMLGAIATEGLLKLVHR